MNPFSENKKTNIASLILGIYIVTLLWLTIFSRSQSDQVYIFYPFKDYVSLFSGNVGGVFHIVGNILLFIPAGYYVKLLFKKNCKTTVFIGFGVSLTIELIQLFTKLGCFEFDDLMHNSLGTFLGYLIYTRLPLTITLNFKKIILWIAIGVAATFIAFFSCIKITDYITYQRQVSFAAVGDGINKKNLLIMDCEDKTSSDGSVSLAYKDDGTIHITGTSNVDCWFKLGEINLEPGTYSFTGFSDASWETIAIYLEYKENGEENYQLISQDSLTIFTLSSATDVTANVIVYKNYNCDISARPVIYKEE